MSKIGSLVHAFALIACICVVAPPSLANLPGGVGWFEGGVGLPGVQQCVGSMVDVSGCVQELMSSVLRVQPGLVGAACCDALLQIDQSCWPKMFPLTMSFLPQLKNHCLDMQDLPQTPPFSSCSAEDDDEDCDNY